MNAVGDSYGSHNGKEGTNRKLTETELRREKELLFIDIPAELLQMVQCHTFRLTVRQATTILLQSLKAL